MNKTNIGDQIIIYSDDEGKVTVDVKIYEGLEELK